MKAFDFFLRVVPMLALALTALLSPGAAFAQAPAQCAPSLAIALAHLSGKYGEAPLWTGQDSAGRSVLVTVGPDGGSWSLVFVDVSGLACLLASGETWTVPPLAAPGQEG